MPGTSFDPETEVDSQDQAETLDETHTVGGEGGEIRTFGENPDMRSFEELPDVEDVTQRVGDRDDDEGVALDADEFDEEAFGDEDLEEDHELDYRARSKDEDDYYDGEDRRDLVDPFDDAAPDVAEVAGQREVHDAGEATGGEDDFTDFQAKAVSDEDLREMGYLEDGGADASEARRDARLEQPLTRSARGKASDSGGDGRG